jgi:hypothetical protein
MFLAILAAIALVCVIVSFFTPSTRPVQIAVLLLAILAVVGNRGGFFG